MVSLLAQWRLTSAGFLGLGAIALALVALAWLRSRGPAEEERVPLLRVLPFLLAAIAAIPIAVGARELVLAPPAAYARNFTPDAAARATARLIAWGAGLFAGAGALSSCIRDGKRSYRVVLALVAGLVALIFARASLPGLGP